MRKEVKDKMTRERDIPLSSFEARELITPLQEKQTELREALKEVDPRSEEAREIRRRMMANRRGPTGLRGLNNRLRPKYTGT